MTLVGRADELRRIEELLDALPGRGGGLLVRGEPGIGKSALLEEAARTRGAARDARAQDAGVESEARLAVRRSAPAAAAGPRPPRRLAGAAARRASSPRSGWPRPRPPDLFLIALAALEPAQRGGRPTPPVMLSSRTRTGSTAPTVRGADVRRPPARGRADRDARRGRDGARARSPAGLPELHLDGLDADARRRAARRIARPSSRPRCASGC